MDIEIFDAVLKCNLLILPCAMRVKKEREGEILSERERGKSKIPTYKGLRPFSDLILTLVKTLMITPFFLQCNLLFPTN